ncbi:TetR/AcrR family transcriptional regulator [Sphingomonas sp. AOB5]|uniref:TetR/AcrR family transcriptional regulator n=1 Tax=Sphingomonas sp. AOB5 TaxID=3034017 RepID=UPI0023F722AB|nr:TetR/AcrR family transcriptional regulator [Sphingomonas sp. AOB5]MDF7774844.1 TetR/AcrR family transcriptional regulator [Sphingomonas sp. AOB5]
MERKRNKTPTSAMGRRRAAAQSEQGAHYSQRLQNLHATAALLFKERGLGNVSLDDIAKTAGLNRASIYYYTSSKEELFFDIAIEAMEKFAVNVDAIVESQLDFPAKITAFLVTLMEHYEANYPHLYAFVQEIDKVSPRNAERQKALSDLTGRVDALVYRIITGGMADGSLRSDVSPRILAHGLLGMANWSHRWFKPDGGLSGADIGRQFARIVLDGMIPDKAADRAG